MVTQVRPPQDRWEETLKIQPCLGWCVLSQVKSPGDFDSLDAPESLFLSPQASTASHGQTNKQKNVRNPLTFIFILDEALIHWWGEPIVKPSTSFPFSLCCVTLSHLHGMSFKGMRPGGGTGQFWLNRCHWNLAPEPNQVCSLQCSHLRHASWSNSKRWRRHRKTYLKLSICSGYRGLLNSNNCEMLFLSMVFWSRIYIIRLPGSLIKRCSVHRVPF